MSHGHDFDRIKYYDLDQVHLFINAIDKQDQEKVSLGVKMIALAMSGDSEAINQMPY